MLGFRGTPAGMADDRGTVIWTGTLLIDEAGVHDFEVRASDTAEVRIGGTPVQFFPTQGRLRAVQRGTARLEPGAHELRVTHRWTNGDGSLELLVRPPGRNWTIVGGSLLRE
jgi:hypothetical protein